MNDYHWPTIRDHAIRVFRNELPHAETEAAVLRAFELYPAVVAQTIDDVAELLAQGRIRTGWGVLRTRLQDAARPVANVTVHGDDHTEAVRSAERWIQNAGAYYPDWTEVRDDLFDEGRGPLRRYNDDTVLHRRLEAVYTARRPAANQAEQQQTQDADRRRQQRADTEARNAERQAALEQQAARELVAAIERRRRK